MTKSTKTKAKSSVTDQDFKKLSEEYLANWQLAQADLENLKKDLVRKQSEIYQQAEINALTPLLSLADNFQAMLKHVPDELAENAWVTGVLHIAQQLESVLESQGVVKINPEKAVFNPEEHEAVESLKVQDQPAGRVLEVVQVGYKLADRLLRPAQVKVAK